MVVLSSVEDSDSSFNKCHDSNLTICFGCVVDKYDSLCVTTRVSCVFAQFFFEVERVLNNTLTSLKF